MSLLAREWVCVSNSLFSSFTSLSKTYLTRGRRLLRRSWSLIGMMRIWQLRKETGSFELNMIAKIGNCLSEFPVQHIRIVPKPAWYYIVRATYGVYKCLLTLPCMHILSNIFPFSIHDLPVGWDRIRRLDRIRCWIQRETLLINSCSFFCCWVIKKKNPMSAKARPNYLPS